MNNNKIWDKVLSPKEEIKYEFGVSKRFIMVAGICGAILGLATFGVVTAISLFWMWYVGKAHHYAFTNKRVLIHEGWLATKLISIDYDKITDVQIRENLTEKVFYKTGILVINTAGTSAHEVVLKHIDSPYEVKKKLDEIREGE